MNSTYSNELSSYYVSIFVLAQNNKNRTGEIMDTFNTTKEYLDLIEKYKLIAENIDECIWLFDLANKRFKYISPSIFNLRGLTVEEAMNEKLEDCLTPESLKKVKSQGINRLPQFLHGDRGENIASSIDEYDQYCKDGTIKTIEISTKLILNKETNNVYVLGVSRDVSYRKSLNKKTDCKSENSFNTVHGLLGIDKGRVYCFGKLLVYGNSSNSPVKWRTKKSEELFAYLLQNRGQEISKWKICDTLWSECDPNKVNNRLHTTLYKMKKTLNSANINFNIKFINGCYWFNLPDAYIDIAEFDSAITSDMIINDDTVKKYKKIFLLYKNRYLDGTDFVWSFAQMELYSIKYHKLVRCLIDYYMKKNSYIDAKRIVHNVLEIYPLDEYANEICLKLHLILKDRISFINHYKYVQELYKAELGIEPSSAIQKLYNSIK
ncbi:PAS domain S-box protein [Clostridium sp. JS66]|uniref:PAS domain S-box protein n=1 Tax=Clostridium sp. JS66 TaxID=3064705 RepID=UPI00298D97B6|nr:PAS domain S-box protein [Clostridium sp. JS66]WPC44320.1 PAS domain S-box protein [Clostridium sp. JS66]